MRPEYKKAVIDVKKGTVNTEDATFHVKQLTKGNRYISLSRVLCALGYAVTIIESDGTKDVISDPPPRGEVFMTKKEVYTKLYYFSVPNSPATEEMFITLDYLGRLWKKVHNND